MAFFNLTYTGHQNVFNEFKLDASSKSSGESTQRLNNSNSSDPSTKYSAFRYKEPMNSNLK